MKTNILLLAVLFCASLTAQDNVNLMKNSDFEDQNYTSFLFTDYEGDESPKPEIIKGWDLKYLDKDSIKTGTFNNKGMDQWNVFCRYVEHNAVAAGEEEGSTLNALITEDNFQFMRLQRQAWNGWELNGLESTHEVAAGTDYEFSCLYAGVTASKRKNKDGWEGEVTRRIRIYENSISEENVVLEELIEDAAGIPWTSFSKKITPSQNAEKVIIKMELNGHGEQAGDGENKVWFDFDDVKFVGKQVSNYILDTPEGTVGVEEFDAAAAISVYKSGDAIVIAGAPANSTVSLYSLAGNLLQTAAVDSDNYTMSTSAYPSGVYIVKAAGKSFKVVL